MLEWILMALALNADCLAVAVATGCCITGNRNKTALKLALVFALVQGLFPLLGWLAGMQLGTLICDYDHWIAFALLIIIGGKMMYEGFTNDSSRNSVNPENIWLLLILGMATSIDALAVGASVGFIGGKIVGLVLCIVVVTFIVSFAGSRFSSMLQRYVKFRIEIAGGLILMGLGVKILVEHLIQ